MALLDLHKAYRPYYRAGREPEIIQFPAIGYIAISGQGELGGSEFIQKAELLIRFAQSVKRYCKERGSDFAIPKLEALWWSQEKQLETERALGTEAAELSPGSESPPESRGPAEDQGAVEVEESAEDREAVEGEGAAGDEDSPTEQLSQRHLWKLLFRLPDFANEKLVNLARMAVTAGRPVSHAAEMGYEKIKEGKCIQIMHVGPYSSKEQTTNRLLLYVSASGMELNGPHHEIYISDSEKTEPSKLKTLIRYPVK